MTKQARHACHNAIPDHELALWPVGQESTHARSASAFTGRNGHFGLVIGVARQGEHAALREGGTDLVVDDLGAIELDGS